MIIFYFLYWLIFNFFVWYVVFENLFRLYWFFENSMNKIFIGDGFVFKGYFLYFGYCIEKNYIIKGFFV